MPKILRLRSTACALLACSALLSAGGALAQAQSSAAAPAFLFINQERIFTQSRPGQEILAEEEAAREQLRSEARAIDQAFEEEEKRLNELRTDMDAAEFRALADEFDARVIAAREEQDQRSDTLAQEFDRKRRQFYSAVAPILVDVMDRYGARAIFDENSVLLADQTLNITDAVIAEIDALHAVETDPDAGAATNDGE